MYAFRMGRGIVFALVVLAGLILWLLSAINNAANYSEVTAVVEHVDEVCVPVGEPVERATACSATNEPQGGKPIAHHNAVRVRYTSPVDDQEHSGTVVPIGGPKAVEALKLRPGDSWTILAHKRNAEDVKAD